MRTLLAVIAVLGCDHGSPPGATDLGASLRVPTVANHGLIALDPALPMVVVTPTGIVIDGKAIEAVSGGDVDPADKEGGALGLTIPRVRDFMKAFAAEQVKRGTPAAAVTLAIDPTTPYHLLVEVMFSLKQAGMHRFVIGVRAGSALEGIPIELPESAPPRAEKQLGMFVTLAKAHVQVWSISGEEGTLKAPALDVPAGRVADVQKTLEDIADRRWHGAPRADVDRQIVVMADSTTSMQQVADVMVAVRTRADGSELFPTLLLSSGIE
ncbi:MAG TPA: hypothetical protein VLX92_33850 [Kofleriaceae bacterium]|nr:hypothetical protein [Kofleriaceae bacterium]